MSGQGLAIMAAAALALAAAGRRLSGSRSEEPEGAITLKNMRDPYLAEAYERKPDKIEQELHKLKGKILEAEASSRWDRRKDIRGTFTFNFIDSSVIDIPGWVISLLGQDEADVYVQDYIQWEVEALLDAMADKSSPLYQEWVDTRNEGWTIEHGGTLKIPHDLGPRYDEAEEIEEYKIETRRTVAGMRMDVKGKEVKALFENMNYILMCLQQKERMDKHLEEEMKEKALMESDEWWEQQLEGSFSDEDIRHAKREEGA